ncbi:MAG: carboxypeptidase regulatory-like domain-containing protein [Phycisphaerae bacterium]|nr:carboxypeptidase regulatory-like domain-containing protein [Gemmatimonadaceae bacterium]
MRVVLLFACCFLHVLVTNASAQTVTVRGRVFDSLAMKPAVGAAVFIPGTTHLTTADRDGRFELRDIEPGRHFVRFSSPALDSLGLGALGAQVSAGSDPILSIALGTPSFRTIWGALCRNQRVVGADSGIVWGTIRDAATDVRLHGALAEFGWTEPRVTPRKQVEIVQKTREALSDSTGNFVACGLPLATNLIAVSSTARSMSGALQFIAGERRLLRLDMLVSSEMITTVAKANSERKDSSVVTKRRGTSTVRGVVRDEKLRVVGEASISLPAIDSAALTAADGSFTLAGLPAGTHQVEVRRIGYTPTVALLHLRPGTSSDLTLSLNSISELARVDVKAEAVAGRDRVAFKERRKAGFGYALDVKTLAGRVDMQSALSQLPQLVAGRNRGELTITSYSSGQPCRVPRVWLNGFPSSLGEASMILMSDLIAVEWFPRVLNAPARYMSANACAVILFWTKQARWEYK